MTTRIDGHYIARNSATQHGDQDAIRIERTDDAEWKILWATDAAPMPMTAISREYRVVVGEEWEGLGHFDGDTLSGYFPIHAFNEDESIPEMMIMSENIDEMPAIGTFEAKLRADGSFAVTIERWDGHLPPNMGHAGWFEPEMERIETVWLRSRN